MQGTKLAAALTAFTLFGAAQAQAASYLVPGSDRDDFSIRCQQEGKPTLEVQKRSGIDDMQVARNIFVTEQSGGRSLLSFKHGFTNPSEDGSHLTATNESCTFLQR